MTIRGAFVDEEGFIPFPEIGAAIRKFAYVAVPNMLTSMQDLEDIREAVARDLDPHDMRIRPGEVPTPKTTPPMWAPNPTRSRRDRRSTRRVK